MALTGSFKELMQKRVASGPAFGEALVREGIDTMLAGDVDTGKAILRDYMKATVGFDGYLHKHAGVELHVTQGPG